MPTCAASFPAGSGRCCATAHAGSIRGRSSSRSSASPISQEETFERDIADIEALHAELRRMSVGVAGYLERRGECARTVTTKVRYPDFAIRSRSTTLPAGIDDAETIGDLACGLLDRALRDRPGPLRLVGVGVSNLEPFRQLAIA